MSPILTPWPATVDDSFIIYLFELIEELSDDANDPYHYHIIRVLVHNAILNVFRQFANIRIS